MDARRPLDDAERLIRRAHRRKRLWLIGGCVVLPIVLVTGYIGSIGAICWGQSSGVLSSTMSTRIPEWYVAAFGVYLTEGGPGSMQLLRFVAWCSWVGDHDETWEAVWRRHRADYLEHLDEMNNREP